MPQTSPINWSISTLYLTTLILYMFNNINEMENNKINKKSKFNMIIQSWNW